MKRKQCLTAVEIESHDIDQSKSGPGRSGPSTTDGVSDMVLRKRK